MEAKKIAAMQAYCDELTKVGKELSVTWEGGNDSGWFCLRLDGSEIEELSPIENEILRFVETDIGYGSFDGDFSADGSVVYDLERKCFLGQDSYSGTEHTLKECSIVISIPDHVWFDKLLLSIESSSSSNDLQAETTLQIFNGPYPKDFDEIQSQLESDICKMFSEIIRDIDDFDGIWQNFTINRSDFHRVPGMLRCNINAFSYSARSSEVKELCIPIGDYPSEKLALY